MQALSEAVANLVMSGNQEGTTAKELTEALHHQWLHIQKIITIRIELSLIFVSFHKITHNVSNILFLFVTILFISNSFFYLPVYLNFMIIFFSIYHHYI